MTRADVKLKVQVLLEELSPFTTPGSCLAIPNNDVQPVVSYIQQTIDKAYDDVLLAVPLHVIKLTDIGSTSPTPTINPNPHPTITIGTTGVDKGVGTFAIPNDYLRLHTMKVSDWERVVNNAISSESPLYAKQRNPHTRGRIVKPVVAINKGQFELYSCPSGSTLSDFIYIKKTTYDTANFQDELSSLLIKRTAIKILEIFEQNDKVKVLSAEYQAQLQQLTF